MRNYPGIEYDAAMISEACAAHAKKQHGRAILGTQRMEDGNILVLLQPEVTSMAPVKAPASKKVAPKKAPPKPNKTAAKKAPAKAPDKPSIPKTEKKATPKLNDDGTPKRGRGRPKKNPDAVPAAPPANGAENHNGLTIVGSNGLDAQPGIEPQVSPTDVSQVPAEAGEVAA